MINITARDLGWVRAPIWILMSIVVFALVGCKSNSKEQPFSFGPEVSATDVQLALLRPLQNNDPSKIKLGEFVHFAEVQTINGQYETVLSDTGQTVVARNETDEKIVFTVIENKINYSQDGQRKISRELELVLNKAQTATKGPNEAALDVAGEIAPFDRLTHVERIMRNEANPLKMFAEVFALQAQTRVTYHNLLVGSETVSPPKEVAAQPNCLGIPDCKIRMNHVAFDQVVWDSSGKGEKVAFEFSISEDVPYLANLMNKCATLMGSLNDTASASSRVLVRQCSPVLNFHFEELPKKSGV